MLVHQEVYAGVDGVLEVAAVTRRCVCQNLERVTNATVCLYGVLHQACTVCSMLSVRAVLFAFS